MIFLLTKNSYQIGKLVGNTYNKTKSRFEMKKIIRQCLKLRSRSSRADSTCLLVAFARTIFLCID